MEIDEDLLPRNQNDKDWDRRRKIRRIIDGK